MKTFRNCVRFFNIGEHFMKARLIVLFAAVSVVAVGSPLWADWTGTNSTAWNDAGNWGGAFPGGGGAANVNTVSPNIATITADSLFSPNSIYIGSGAQINHTAGSLSTGSGWSSVGVWNNSGIYNLADTTGTGGMFTGYGQGSGNLTLGGMLSLGGGLFNWVATGGTGTINVNTTGTLALTEGPGNWWGTSLVVGGVAGTGIFNLDNGTVTSTNETIVIGNSDGSGSPAGNGTLNMSGGRINAPALLSRRTAAPAT